MPKKQSHWSQVVDAWLESNRAVLEAIKKGNERGFRFSMRLIAEAERSQQEIARLNQRLSGTAKRRPSLYREGVELARRSADRSAELAEEFVAAASEAGEELRDTATTLIHAHRSAAQALLTAFEETAGGALQSRKKPARRAAPRRKRATRQAIERTVEQAAAASNHPDGH